MKKCMLITLSAILWIALSSAVFAGTCTDRSFSVDTATDDMCTSEYDYCRTNYTTDMALPSEVPTAVNDYCTDYADALVAQTYDATDAAYCMDYSLMGGGTPLPDSGDTDYCFAAQSCIAEQWQLICDDEADLCCLGGTIVITDPVTDPIPDPIPDPVPADTTPNVDDIDYTSNTYGFSITLPSGWSNFYTTQTQYPDVLYFDFYLPSSDGDMQLFSLGISTDGVPEMEEYLGENDTYTFSFSHFNGIAPDDLLDRVLEFDQIKQSFYAFDLVSSTTYDTDSDSPFSDISLHQYESAITYVEGQGIVNGYEDGTYKPNNPINRAEFMKIVMESGFDDSVFGGTNCFTDVTNDWYAQYVCAAKDLGIVSGYPDNSFKPGSYINLAEALKIIFETAAYISDETIEPVAGEWYQSYLDLANALGLINTINSDIGHNLTRGEMAEMIYLADTL
jgi:S-layer homology domain